MVPALTHVFGETTCCGGPSPNVQVDAFHADTGELAATTHSVESLDCTGCYELLLPAGETYTFRATFPGWSTGWFRQPGGPAGGFGLELPPGERRVDLALFSESAFIGRVVDAEGSPVAGARVLALPSRSPVPPIPQEGITVAGGTFAVVGLQSDYFRLLLIGPDGTWTLAGMVGGDPDTATEFLADFRGGFPVDVGDITLAS